MKLLIITQKVAPNDPILGFFCRWIEEFAKHCQKVTVITQSVASGYVAPRNVTVLSLGKEREKPRKYQIYKFLWFLWSRRRQYTRVLVHMTPIWAVIGKPMWWLLRKPVYLWYEARGGGWALPVTLRFVKKSFGATGYGQPRISPRRRNLGHGIDLDFFPLGEEGERRRGRIVTVGRITPRKHLDTVISAFSELPASTELVIAGGTVTPSDEVELKKLKKLIDERGLNDRVSIGWVQRSDIAAFFRHADLMLHACDGGLDKVVLEAIASGCPVVTTSTAAKDVLPSRCIATPETLGTRARDILALSDEERSALAHELRDRVRRDHSLPELIEGMVAEMQSGR